MTKQYPDLPLVDADGLHRIPTRLYLYLLLLLRPYLLWVLALLMPQQQTDLLGFLYPYRDDFIQAVLVAIPAVLVLTAISQRVPYDAKQSRGRAKWFWFGVWRHSRVLLCLTAVADLSLLGRSLLLQGQAHPALTAILALLLVGSTLWLLRNHQVGLVFAEWPDDKKAR